MCTDPSRWTAEKHLTCNWMEQGRLKGELNVLYWKSIKIGIKAAQIDMTLDQIFIQLLWRRWEWAALFHKRVPFHQPVSLKLTRKTHNYNFFSHRKKLIGTKNVRPVRLNMNLQQINIYFMSAETKLSLKLNDFRYCFWFCYVINLNLNVLLHHKLLYGSLWCKSPPLFQHP